jgi:pyruvate,water dikinase
MIANTLRRWWQARRSAGSPFPLAAFHEKYNCFQRLQESNAELLGLISDAEEKLQGDALFGAGYLLRLATRAVFHTGRMVYNLDQLAAGRYAGLKTVWERIAAEINGLLARPRPRRTTPWVLPFAQIDSHMADLVGGKSANLGEVATAVGLPIPAGFAITTAAFDAFLAHNNLVDQINQHKMDLADDRPETFESLSARIQALFDAAAVPPAVEAAILEAYDRLAAPTPGIALPRVALRSSGLGEDGGEMSFAGQYLSLLGIRRADVADAYRRVLASLFSPRAIAYRLQQGIRLDDIAMGVTCQQMVDARVSGILFTRDPVDARQPHMLVNAVWGLGTAVADGDAASDVYRVGAETPHPVLERRVARKTRQSILADSGVVAAAVDPELQDRPCLSDDQLRQLAAYGRRLEAHYGEPQDVEWAIDDDLRLLVLQSRPLTALAMQSAADGAPPPPAPGYELLASGGDVACSGAACGPAHVVLDPEDLHDFPDQGVVLAPHSSPHLVTVMHRASAIVAATGSLTGHMASLAREFALPTILNLPGAVDLVPPGTVITVDAAHGRIYRGRVASLLARPAPNRRSRKSTQMYRWLQALATHIVPLNLTDPESRHFNAAGCRTLHDIMRLVHEVGYREMFQISDLATDRARLSMKLEAGIPLDLYVIDLGGGLAPQAAGQRRIVPDQVVSRPFQALLAGMTCDALVHREPRPLNMGGLFSVFSRQMLSPPAMHDTRFGQKSYAIISDHYLNFSSRIGYHFSILDTNCVSDDAKNYINFEFKGGAADDVRRNRRARLIQRIFTALGFLTRVQGDRVQARLGKRPLPVIAAALDQVGRLIMYTRQMDMLMHDERSVNVLAECFLAGDYAIQSPGEPPASVNEV